MAVPPTPFHDKPALRRALRATRAAFVASLTANERHRLEEALAAILVAHLPAGVVAAYRAVASEIAPRCERATLYPRVTAGHPLSFHAAPPDEHRPGVRSIPKPDAGAPLGRPDVVLVPLLGVDRAGNRLGQGAGYYDRTLSELRASGPVFAVGIAWDVQVVDALPADPWDAPLDALATPSGWTAFAR